MSEPQRLIDPEKRGEDVEQSLRPQSLDDFTGQAEARANLKIFIEAAKNRGEALDHVLFVGPPGLGKTTLAQIMAKELGVNFRSTSGPVIAKSGDLAALLTNLEDGDVLFIDEIHRLNPAVEEILELEDAGSVADLLVHLGGELPRLARAAAAGAGALRSKVSVTGRPAPCIALKKCSTSRGFPSAPTMLFPSTATTFIPTSRSWNSPSPA